MNEWKLITENHDTYRTFSINLRRWTSNLKGRPKLPYSLFITTSFNLQYFYLIVMVEWRID